MEKVKIKCTTGITLPLDEIHYYPNNLKKHSILEIERLVDSIINDGFLFPVAIGKLNGTNYIIDGEASVEALCELQNRGFEIPEIPVFLVRCKTEQDLRKAIIIATSTNHIVTKPSLIEFTKGYDINLKLFGFNEGTYLDFWTINDIDRYFEMAKTLKEKGLSGKEDYFGLLKDGQI